MKTPVNSVVAEPDPFACQVTGVLSKTRNRATGCAAPTPKLNGGVDGFHANAVGRRHAHERASRVRLWIVHHLRRAQHWCPPHVVDFKSSRPEIQRVLSEYFVKRRDKLGRILSDVSRSSEPFISHEVATFNGVIESGQMAIRLKPH